MSEFDKIIGYEDIKRELRKLCDVVKNPDRYTKLGVTLPGGILLEGDPGLGKTLMAKCFIAEAGCKAFVIRKEKPNGDFVKEIKEVFEKAKSEDSAIVFLDDMDKFANEDDHHPNAEEFVTVQSCIDECKGHNVFVLATINEKDCLPDSLLRAGRFDKIIELRIPRGEEAKSIIKHFINEKQIDNTDLDIEELARLMEGYTCAELETVINDAGINAGFEGRDRITRGDIVDACLRMLLHAPECFEKIDDYTIRKIAVHEAGHAVVAEVLSPGSVSIVSIRRSTGSTGGITKHMRDAGYTYSQKSHEMDIICGLGGKAANEIAFGDSDIGCGKDMDKVFDMVAAMIDDFCTKGFENHTMGLFRAAESTKTNKERTIATEVARFYEQAKRIIVENRELFDAITNALLERITLTYNDIEKIRKAVS